MPGVGVGVGPCDLPIYAQGGGVDALYDPATDTDRILLYEADHASNTLVGGTTYSQLTDLTGRGRHATQATGSKQPTRIASGINGLPIARFDGSNDSMGIALVPLTNQLAFTLYLVLTNGPTATTLRYFFDQIGHRLVAAAQTDQSGKLGAFDTAWRNTGADSTAALQTLAFEFNGAANEFRLYRNGTQIGSTVATSAPKLFDPAVTAAAFFSSSAQTGQFVGADFASAFFVGSLRATHNVSNRCDNYFRTKWGTP